MKKRIACICVLLLLLPGILLGTALSLPDLYQDSYYAELPAMADYLHQAEGNRLILIGGSSVAFGVDTALLESLLREHGLDYTVCPFGYYAAIGTSAMLSLAQGELRAGDVVVLAVEPVSEALSDYFGATAFLKAAEGRADLLPQLNGSQRTNIIGNAIPFLQEKVDIVRSGNLPRAEGVYARASFDARCNMVYARPGNTMALGYDTTSPIDLRNVTISADLSEQVSAFCETARQRGAQVLLSFSPMNRSALTDESDDVFLAFYERMRAALPCRVISDPRRYVLDSGWFYDSNFHLNSAGAAYRTMLLAEDLLAEFGCYQPLDAELPTMPAPVVQSASWAEDTGDFVFAETADGQAYCIAGLTEQGKAKGTLMLPASYQGKPVIALDAEALIGADALEELHVPERILSLPDGVLLPCKSLKRLVLAHTTAPCGITEHSLDGAEDVQILVPYAAYAYYRDGYGCEANHWQGYLGQIRTY